MYSSVLAYDVIDYRYWISCGDIHMTDIDTSDEAVERMALAYETMNYASRRETAALLRALLAERRELQKWKDLCCHMDGEKCDNMKRALTAAANCDARNAALEEAAEVVGM